MVISDPAANRTVTGVATVGGQAYMVISGKTYAWDQGTNSVSCSIATPYVDLGEEGYDKTVRGLGLTAYSTGTIGAAIHAATVLENIDTTFSSPDASFSFTPGSGPQQTLRAKTNVRRARLASAAIAVTSSGGNLARVDEVYFDVSVRENIKY
jgi:hypothetical protein